MRRITAIAKGLERFSTGKACSRDHIGDRYTSTGQCVECTALFASNYEHKPQRIAYRQRRWREKSQAAKMVQGAKYRARAVGKEFTLAADDIEVPLNCPCCGVEFVVREGRGTLTAASPTLDRVDNDFGYAPGNVWVICHRCNSIKRDASADELRNIADAIDRQIRQTHLLSQIDYRSETPKG